MYRLIYPIKDSYLYELNTNDEKNFGGDNNLVLKKDIVDNTLNGVSRLLLQFDLTNISKSLSFGEITNPSYYLRLYEQKASELSPTYQLNAYALSSSWKSGTGNAEENLNKRNGTSWKRRNETFNDTDWFVGGIGTSEIPMTSASKLLGEGVNPHLDSGNRKDGGGVWYDEGGLATSDWTIPSISAISSQSFSYQSPDIEMNVTDIINKWLDGTRQNEGFIIKWDTNDSNLNPTSQSQEDSVDKSGDINFYSMDANSVYSPKLEVRWDDSSYTYGGSDFLIADGTKDFFLYINNFKKIYGETEIPAFRIGVRERYKVKSTSTSKSSLTSYFLKSGKAWYSIIDVKTGETIVPFGDNSKLSSDSISSYFKLNLTGFITNRLYRIKVKAQTDDGISRIFNDNFDFRVES